MAADPKRKQTHEQRPARAVEKQPSATAASSRLNRLVHGRVRLGILSTLAVSSELSFSELKQHLSATDGNLSLHARKLEEAGYIDCEKRFENRVPKTLYRITAEGRKALDRYLNHMEAIIQATRKGE